ncbi:MAG: glycoside hydrolase family 31 protein, partial [Lachnospiraceae bacterium]|nr:glycoside hydrolase family 31 protein [Lachnospiraceae bacterium]
MNADYNPQLGKRRTLFPDSEDYLVNVEHIQEQGDGLVLMVRTAQGRSAAVRAEFLTDSVIRLRMSALPEEKERNAVFDFNSMQKENRNAESGRSHAEIRPTNMPGHIVYGNDDIQLSFRTDFWEMSVSQRGKEILRDQSYDTNVDNRWKVLPAGFTFPAQGAGKEAPVCARMNLLLRSDEAIWGLGEKFTSLNKRGQRIHCWQKDALSTNTEDAYKSHPFYISSYGYGLLLNTYARSCFDIGCTSQVSLQISAEDTLLDVILFLDPEVRTGLDEAPRGSGFVARILSSYVRMTGGIPLIPKWAFGYWQSKCSYLCRKQVEEVAADAAKYHVPLDVIHLDSWQKKENAGTWEWNTEAYPRPEEMIDNLHDKGIHLSIWNYPYVSENSPEFRKIETCGYFIRN